MRLDKLALTAQQALQQAIIIASDAEASSVEPIHLLKALTEAGENNLNAIIKRIGADPAQIKASVDAEVAKMPKVSGQMQVIPSQDLMKGARRRREGRREAGRQLRHERASSHRAVRGQGPGG